MGGGGLAPREAEPDPFLDADATFAPAPTTASGEGAPAARPYDRARTRTDMKVLQSKKGLEEETGDVAVETSKAIRELKEDDVAAPKDTRVRYVGGKVFRWDSGWVDQEWKAGMPTMKVKYLSEAYFTLLRELPQLKQWLSLGARVTVVVKGTAVIVSAEGQETLGEAELRKLK